jgi:hypothetical protein
MAELSPYDIYPKELARLVEEILKEGVLLGFSVFMEKITGSVKLAWGPFTLLASPSWEGIDFHLEQRCEVISTWGERVEWTCHWTTDLHLWRTHVIRVLQNLKLVESFHVG